MTTTSPVLDQARELSRTSKGRWLSVVSHTDPRYGGLSSAVPRGAGDIVATGRFDVSLAAFCAPGEQTRPAGFDDEHLSFWPVSRRPWLQSGALRQEFSEAVRQADGVHIHGLWEASTAVAARTARSLNRPYIVSAHGMLEPWALANKRWKKLVYAQLIERELVARATCLHALTEAEAQQYRAFGAKCPIAVIPNAVEIPEVRSAQLFFANYPQLQGLRLVLFLGRLHPKKGLNLLIEAWGRVSKLHPEAHLVLAGPDAEGTEARMLAAMAATKIEGAVTFTGMLQPAMKWSALAAAEGFVLPSYSEGLSMGVLEAMGAGLPVIVTRNCNMPEVRREDAGWEVAADAGELASALQELLGNSPEENRSMGARGAYLVTNRYNPRHVAREMADLYDYALNGIRMENVEMRFV